MPEVTITGKIRNPIRDLPYTSGTTEIALGAGFGAATIGYLPQTKSYKTNSDGINGSSGVKVVVNDTGTTDYSFVFPDFSARTIAISGADSTQTLEDLLSAGGAAPTGSTLLVSGTINYPQSNTAWVGAKVVIECRSLFATQDGVYLPMSKAFRVTEEGINASSEVDSDGVTLYVPNGIASEWRFSFYNRDTDETPLEQRTAYFDDSMGVVEIADVLDGLYATWIAPMVAPSNVTLVVSGATRNEVTLTWDDNSGDETGFEVEYSENGTTWNLLTTTAAGVETYTHTTAHGTYPLNLGAVTLYYRVRAVKSGGLSGWASASISGLLFGLVSYWKMNETSGNRADSVGVNHLVPSGTLNATTGKIGNAANFTEVGGVDASTVTAAFASGASAPFTLAFWINNSDVGAIFGTSNTVLFLAADGPGIVAYYNAFAGNLQTTLSMGSWHFVVLRYNGTTLSLQIDANTPLTGAVALTSATGLDIRFGGNYVGSQRVDAAIDEAGWWNYALPDDFVDMLYNGGAAATYPFT